MRTRKLIAVKPHRYGTRHLTAGEEYEASHGHAIALVAVKKARFVPDKKPAAAKMREVAPAVEHAAVSAPEPADAKTADEQRLQIDGLRLQATQLGIDVDGRWGVVRLQYEISQRQR